MNPKKQKFLSKIRLTVRVLALIGLLVFFCTRQARAMKLIAPTWFGMESIASRVYVDKAMPAGQRAEILKLVSGAEQQVRRYYGSATAKPKLLFCSREETFQSFGGTKQTGLTVLGYASLFSPRGLSVPIVAHEWSHVEFYSRVDLRRWLGVPQWFDEGLAVTVSEEPRHAESVYQEALQAGASPPPLSELGTLRQWSQAVKKYRDPKLNPGNRALVYATVGHEVRLWFEKVGPTGLEKFCKELNAGTDFTSAYSNAALRFN
jgi:hypothetical protein